MKLYVQNTKIFIHPNSELEHFEKIKNEEYSSLYTWEFFSGIDYEFIELLHFKNLEEKNDFINNLKVFINFFNIESLSLNWTTTTIIKTINHFFLDDSNSKYDDFQFASDFYWNELHYYNFYLKCFKFTNCIVYKNKNIEEDTLNPKCYMIFESLNDITLKSKLDTLFYKKNIDLKIKSSNFDLNYELQGILDNVKEGSYNLYILQDILLSCIKVNDEIFLKLLESFEDKSCELSSSNLGKFYSTIGKHYFTVKDFKNSLKFLEKALQHNNKLSVSKMINISRSNI